MIRYALRCSKGHDFDSWFQSAEAFEKLQATGMVSCAACGDTAVHKTLMTPNLGAASTRKAGAAPAPAAASASASAPEKPLSTPATPVEEALAALKKQVEESSDYVGKNFVQEARKMHEGETPERAIYGEARVDEARKLVEDGIPVTPLPFAPNRKIN